VEDSKYLQQEKLKEQKRLEEKQKTKNIFEDLV